MPLIPSAEPARQVMAEPKRRAGVAPAGNPADRAGSASVDRLVSASAIHARRAVRSFAGKRVDRRDLDFVLAAATSAGPWPQAGPGDLELLVFARSVAGLGYGAYLARRGGYQPVDADLPADLWRSYADAPVLLFLCADLAACAPDVAGYPTALFLAGAVGHACWLAAVSTGLGGCPYGGTSGPATVLARRALGPGWRHLFTLSLGHSVGPS